MSSTKNQPILIVEDSPEDYETIMRAFKKARISNPVFHCEDGDEALDFLFQRGEYQDIERSPRPALVLLDLNLPGTDGRDVLSEVKRTESLKQIPILVLTTSNDERDIHSCYTAGANSYIQKPVDLAGFMTAIGRLKDYWLELVLLPGNPNPARR